MPPRTVSPPARASRRRGLFRAARLERPVSAGRRALPPSPLRRRPVRARRPGSCGGAAVRRRCCPTIPMADAVVLIEQFRLPALAAGIDPVLVELPAGLCDDGETPETTAAARDRCEEMGLRSAQLQPHRQLPADAGRRGRAVRPLSPAACRRRRPTPTASPATPAWRTSTRTSACVSGRPTSAIEAALAGQMTNSVTAIGLLWLAAQRDGAAEGVDARHDGKAVSRRPAAARRRPARCWPSGPEGIVLDRTVFYARSGGQPGDVGVLRWDGGETAIADTVKGEGETILHLPAPGAALPPVGATRGGRDRLGPPLPADAHAHGDASAVQPDQGRGGDRRLGRRGPLAAGFRPAQPAAQGGRSRPA